MSGLNFQDFGIGASDKEFDSPFTNNSVNSNYDRRNTENLSANLVDGSETEATPNKQNFLSFKFYQNFFDVDTEQVYSRILNSVIPKKGGNFIRDQIQPSPDLYGPFWICVTLVFSAAIFANLSRYIDSMGDDTYTNDFKLVTGISTMIACYVLIIPAIIYAVLYYRNSAIQYGFIELVTLYGYSLSIFIPVSILWVIHFQSFRWLLIIVSVLLSGSVLVATIWDAVKSDKNKLVAFGIIFGVIFLHTVLAVGMKEYYFDTMLPVNQNTNELGKQTQPSLVADLPNTAEVKPKAEALVAQELSKNVSNTQHPTSDVNNKSPSNEVEVEHNANSTKKA